MSEKPTPEVSHHRWLEGIRNARRERELSTIGGLLRAAWSSGKKGDHLGLQDLYKRGEGLLATAECKGWNQGFDCGLEVGLRPPESA